MAQKLKSNTRIPTVPKQPTISTSTNVSSGILKDAKSIISRAPHLRRSKSMQEFGLLSSNKPSISILVKKPIKRSALTTTTVANKIPKVEIKAKPKPIKVVPKIPPYDYKARFNHLKEIHDKLKTEYRNLKEVHESTADQNEELLTSTNNLQANFDITSQKYNELQEEHDKLKEKHNNAEKKLNKLEVTVNYLENNLKTKTESLDTTLKEYNEIKDVFNKIKLKLTSTEEQLEKSQEINTFLKEELRNFQDEKRKMHNIIQELKGNIRVFCRIRPPIGSEENKLLYGVNYLDDTSLEMFKTKDKKTEFSFDKVFGPGSTQENIFLELSQLVQSALDGYNVCVFAYGQTGSGKTYTMEGKNSSVTRGMIPRSVDTIFHTIESMKRLGWIYKIKASFLEIYNETIVDLLNPKKNNLEIKMCDAKGTDVYVPNLTIEKINNADKLISLMKIAQRNRAVAATENNERSSRSHSVTKITLEGINSEQNEKSFGNLNLIDLAGSEKFHTNETTRLRETTNINKSLSNLSNVILCLVKKTGHIPYRNSKLTHLLMPSLGGNSKTLMIVNISPLDDCYNESVNSLRFASSVNQCKTGSIKRIKIQT